MGTITGQGIESIAVRRAVIADADKVRYRVYRAPNDFIAVIAESALMAMKVAGIDEPFRIVRDLPTEHVAIEADRLAKVDVPQRVSFSLESRPKLKEAFEIADPITTDFVPMRLRDLERSSKPRTRILSPEEMAALMQGMAASFTPEPAPAPAPVVMAPPPPPVIEPTPVALDITAEPVLPEPEPMAEMQAAPEPAAESIDGALTPEEVARLLGN